MDPPEQQEEDVHQTPGRVGDHRADHSEAEREGEDCNADHIEFVTGALQERLPRVKILLRALRFVAGVTQGAEPEEYLDRV